MSKSSVNEILDFAITAEAGTHRFYKDQADEDGHINRWKNLLESELGQ